MALSVLTLFTLISLASCQPTITPVTSGAVVTSKDRVYEVTGYAKVFVMITGNDENDANWEKQFARIEDTVNKRFSHSRANFFSVEIKAVLDARVQALRTRITRTKRMKRGVFNFIGDIASGLFGIPSASDIDSLKRANQKLADEVEGVVRNQRQIIAKVNQIGRAQQATNAKIDEIIEHQNVQDIMIRNLYSSMTELMEISKYNHDLIRVELLMELIAENIYTYEQAVQEAHNLRMYCESRIVNEDVIPIEMIKIILRKGVQMSDLTPESYYGYIEVEKIVKIENQMICILKAPLFSDHMQQKIQVTTFPVCYDGKCIQIKQPEHFVIDYDNEDLYFPDNCFGPKPQACQPGVVYDKRQQPCLHGLINNDPQQQKECSVEYFEGRPMIGQVQTNVINRYVLTTVEVYYHYRCKGQAPSVASMTKGHYIVDIEENCIMDSQYWMLKGLPVYTYNRSLEVSEPHMVELSWFNLTREALAELKIDLPKGVEKLEVENYEALKQIPESHIRSEIDELQKDIGKVKIPWYVWLLLAIACALGILFLICYARFALLKRSRKRAARQVYQAVYCQPKKNRVQIENMSPHHSETQLTETDSEQTAPKETPA